MARNNKRFISGTVIEVCFRAEEGLPLPANVFIVEIVKSILAQAQYLYPVSIYAVIWMSNHPHMILGVKNPEDVKNFVGYVKRELAHAINRLAGRQQHTVWQEGYDSPLLGSPATVIERLVYLYTNPQKAGLEVSMDNYPHFSTWLQFLNGGGTVFAKRLFRHSIPAVPSNIMTIEEQRAFSERIYEQSGPELELLIEPDAWMKCFPETQDADAERMKAEILRTIKEREATYQRERKSPVMGKEKLQLEPIRFNFKPKKRLKRMLIIDRNKERRRAYIRWHLTEQQIAREVRKLIRAGDFSCIPPPGFFLGGGTLAANILLLATPLLHSFQ